jgi:hypothetical protein
LKLVGRALWLAPVCAIGGGGLLLDLRLRWLALIL